MRSQAAAGRVILGRYELVEPLGEGPLGPLWRARDREGDREVAVREIELPDLLDEVEQAALAEKVVREAQAASRLTHRGVVPVLDVVADDGHPFVVTELVEAPTLAELVGLEGPLRPARAAAVGLDVLDALGAAHDRGLVHRDVQPSNVFLDPEGARLADFGVASLVDDPRMTSSGTVAPFYLAPEQTGSAGASPSSDLWSLAATLYFAVEGRPPFAEDAPEATLDAIRGRAIPPSVRAGRLRPLFDVLLVKDPTMRAGRDRARALLAWAAEGPATVVRPADRPAPDVPAEPLVSPPPAERTEPAEPVDKEEPDTSATTDVAGDAPAGSAPSAPPPPPPPPPPAPPPPPPVDADAADREIASPADDVGVPAEGGTAAEEGDGQVSVAPDEEPPLVETAETPAPTDSWREPWFFGLPVETVPPPPLAEPEPTPPLDDEERRRRRLTRGVWIGVLAVVTAIVLVGLMTTGGRQLNPDRPSLESRAPSPPGETWVPYTDDAIGYSLRHPPGWTIRRQGNQTYFVHPDNIAYLEVDHQQPPAADPVKTWEDLEKTFAASHPSYTKIQIAPSTFQDFRAAVWEFTYTDNGVNLRTLDLGFVTPRYGFALLFQTRAADWDRLQDVLNTFKASFRAPA
jgi:serine/threonine protein kinase